MKIRFPQSSVFTFILFFIRKRYIEMNSDEEKIETLVGAWMMTL